MAASSSRGWYQGPNTYGAGVGWRPMAAVRRRSTSAGRGPAKTRRRSSLASTSTLHERAPPSRNRLVWGLSTSTP